MAERETPLAPTRDLGAEFIPMKIGTPDLRQLGPLAPFESLLNKITPDLYRDVIPWRRERDSNPRAVLPA